MKPTPTILLLTAALSAQDPGSSFGHARTRELAELGRLPTRADVHVADLVDYYPHRLSPPRAGEDIGLDLRLDSTSAGDGAIVLQIGYTTAPADDRSDVPPVHLALVIDCSGSMQAAGKMDRLKQALAALTRRLRTSDCVTLVTYSDDALVQERGRSVGDGRWLRAAIDRLQPGGATNLHAGLMAGLRELQRGDDGPQTRRAILLTDGIANRGETDPARILADARRCTDAGVDLSTIGLGAELNSDLLDRLARGAHGLFHFVADTADIDKVFRQEADTLLCPVARRPVLHVTLPPALQLEKVYGYSVQRSATGFVVPLPDFNRGVTAVVMTQLRLRQPLRGPDLMRIAAHIDYDAADDGTPRRVDCSEDVSVDPVGRPRLSDAELRKNYTVAVLAQGMHDMAACAEQQRWADADRALRTAIAFAKVQFPDGEDQDYQRVLAMAEQFRTTLAPYLDRFRDY